MFRLQLAAQKIGDYQQLDVSSHDAVSKQASERMAAASFQFGSIFAFVGSTAWLHAAIELNEGAHNARQHVDGFERRARSGCKQQPYR